MATRSRQPLDVTRLAAVVLFLIAGGLFARMFFHNYHTVPARAARRTVSQLESMRRSGASPFMMFMPKPGPTRDYFTTGDEQAKRQVIRDAKRRSRAQHWLAIWGTLAVVCGSIIAVVIAGLPMLLELQERRA